MKLYNSMAAEGKMVRRLDVAQVQESSNLSSRPN